MKMRQIFQNRTNVIVVSAVIVLLVAFFVSFSGIIPKKINFIEDASGNEIPCTPNAAGGSSVIKFTWNTVGGATSYNLWADTSWEFNLNSESKRGLGYDFMDENVHRTLSADELPDEDTRYYFKYSYTMTADSGEEIETLNSYFRSWKPPKVTEITCYLVCDDGSEDCEPEDAHAIYEIDWSYEPNPPYGHVAEEFTLEERVGDGDWSGIDSGTADVTSKTTSVEVHDADTTRYYRVKTAETYITKQPLPEVYASGQENKMLEWDPTTAPEVTGYTIWTGSEPGKYTNSVPTDPPLSTNLVVTLPFDGTGHYYSVTAYTADGFHSGFSPNPGIYHVNPAAPGDLLNPGDGSSVVSKEKPMSVGWNRDGGIITGVAAYTYRAPGDIWVLQYTTEIKAPESDTVWTSLSPTESSPVIGTLVYVDKYVYSLPDPAPPKLYIRAVRNPAEPLNLGTPGPIIIP